MEINFDIGIKGQEELVVSYKDTAASYGSGLVEVFATPAMIALMEKTCYKSINSYLPEGYGSVGVKVNIEHIKASKIGELIVCKSELVEKNNKKLIFNLQVFGLNNELVGFGTHERVIINIDKFMSKL